MPKYYIESGNVKTIVSAEDSEKAALWVIHKAMQQILPVYEENGADMQNPGANSGTTSGANPPEVMVLGNKLQISETGFGSQEQDSFETLSLVNHWNQLMIALERLQQLEVAAT